MMLGKNAIYTPVETFEKVITDLRKLIIEGRLDKQVYLQAERLIFSRMSEEIVPQNGNSQIPEYGKPRK